MHLPTKKKKENEINDSFIDLFRFRNHTKLYKMALRKIISSFFSVSFYLYYLILFLWNIEIGTQIVISDHAA